MNFNETLYGIAYHCPLGVRCQNCPFEKIEKLFFEEKVHWIEKRSPEEHRQIFMQHKSCSLNRTRYC